MVDPLSMKRGLLLALVLTGCESTPVLLYHHVGSEISPYVSTVAFGEQMQHLDDAGYTPITVSHFEAILAGERSAPARPIVITFDDGDQDFLDQAFPILEQHGFTATMFLISGVLSEDDASRVLEPWPYLTWPEVLRLEAAGIEMQSHTVTHPALAKIDAAEARREIFESKAALEARLKGSVTALAYPYGNHSIAVRGFADEAGYVGAYSVEGGINRDYDRIRISVGESRDLESFVEALEGTWWGESSGAR
jgi:O-antigen biosynthesis protein